MRRSIVLIVFNLLTLVIYGCSQHDKYPKGLSELFLQLDNINRENSLEYGKVFFEIVENPDTSLARNGTLYYFLEYKKRDEWLLFKILEDIKRLGFYEDWEVLDRFYERYKEKYSREVVRKDSSLMDVHQAYIQFLSVCNYEKIKPLYLQELSETIREGDYTYAFNSYLLPEHWEEAADTLMKYYWEVKDEETRIKMNEAILKLKKNKAKPHYIVIIKKEPYKISRRFFMQFESDTTMLKEYLPYVENAKLKFILEKYLSLRRSYNKIHQ